jgi:putative PIN family toxin of toxin-antitoxin system
VLDTSVLVAALRSSKGVAFKLLSLVGGSRFEIAVSVPLVLEYEGVLTRHLGKGRFTQQDLRDLLDYLCKVAHKQVVFFLWRPYLRDLKDDMVLELAVAADCEAIITYNVRDFEGAEQFGVNVLRPKEFLNQIGVKP